MTRSLVAIVGLAVLSGSVSACSGDDGSNASTTVVGTIPPVAPGEILFSPEGNNLVAYATTPVYPGEFSPEMVNRARHPSADRAGDPDGYDINGQVCVFEQEGTTYLVAGEDTEQPEVPPGWGVFVLTNVASAERGVGLHLERVARLVPTFQPTDDGPDTYGCGVLDDGRVLVTDIGNTALGAANGQLTMFFPPFDLDPSKTDEAIPFCKIDERLATGQAIAVTDDDRVFLNSPRPSDDPDATASGVFEYPGPFPTAPDAAGGCGRTDDLGSPLVDSITKRRMLAAGENELVSPSGLAEAPNGHWFVASVINGVINEYDADWTFVRTVLRPPPGEELGDDSFSTGTPLGLAVGVDGTLFYADIGIVAREGNTPGPGRLTGSINRITFVGGTPSPPETIAANLQFPDGLGLWEP